MAFARYLEAANARWTCTFVVSSLICTKPHVFTVRDLPVFEVIIFCQYFNKPSLHPAGSIIPGYPDLDIAYNDGGDTLDASAKLYLAALQA